MLSGRRKELCFAAWMGALACGQAPVPEVPPAAVAAAPSMEQEARAIPHPTSTGRRRALLVGIDDYSASRLAAGTEGQRWRNLEGAANDARGLQEMLALYGFAPQDVVVLTNQAATRAAIFRAIKEHLIAPAQPGDIVLFFFAGHGSQVTNSLSNEADRLDESLVPADSRRGARDIRDKELRRLFNPLLDRGVRLTIILDSCHSGSGVRGLPPRVRPRGLPTDPRDVADGAPAGSKLEDAGALVLSATQDFGFAWETQDELGSPHGAFSLALLRALRDAAPGESAEEVYLRTRARLQAETFFQEPVLAGKTTVRQTPFLGDRNQPGRRTRRSVLAVERVKSDGTVVLQGGWVNGLAVGSEVRLLGRTPEARLEVTALIGLSKCEARFVTKERTGSVRLESGALAEVVSWAAPPDRPLRVWISQTTTFEAAVELARRLSQSAPGHGVAWIDDPSETTPTHVLQWAGREWELLGPGGKVEGLGAKPEPQALLARLQAPSPSLFVQLPVPSTLARSMVLGSGTEHSGVEPTRRPEEAATYVLAGRLFQGRTEVAWLRPGLTQEDRNKTNLPLRTAWLPMNASSGSADALDTTGLTLEDTVLRLRKIHAWQNLESPATPSWRLALRRESTGETVTGGTLHGEELYGFTLRAATTSPQTGTTYRFAYVFLIDSTGKSVLLFPPYGSVENRFAPPPVPAGSPSPAATEIPLSAGPALKVSPPYGSDTYFLLMSDEALPNPWVLEWDGVRSRGPQGGTALEELLSVTGGATRSAVVQRTPLTWTLERLTFAAVPPGAQPNTTGGASR